MEEFGIEQLPKDCIAHIISLTSPPDACCCAGVSSAFHSAAGSDTVWERFLPLDYQSLLDRSADPIDPSSSKRDLFFRLRNWVLLNGGRMGVRLEKRSWAKCFMLPARTLTIAWIGTPQYWRWIPVADSRFLEAAILIGVCWLEIRGMIQSNILSRNTTYEAFLVFKLTNWSQGFNEHPQEASVALGLQSSTKIVRLVPNYTSFIPIPPMNGNNFVDDDDVNNDDNDVIDNEDDVVDGIVIDDDNDRGAYVVVVNDDDNGDNADVDNADDVDNEYDVVDNDDDHGVDDGGNDHGADDYDDNNDVDDNDDVNNNEDDVVVDDYPHHGVDVVVYSSAVIRVRDDGWLEISIGKVYNENGEDGEMTMSFTEVKALHWKSGLVVLGIEIRPTMEA